MLENCVLLQLYRVAYGRQKLLNWIRLSLLTDVNIHQRPKYVIKNMKYARQWWCKALVPTFRRQRQGDT